MKKLGRVARTRTLDVDPDLAPGGDRDEREAAGVGQVEAQISGRLAFLGQGGLAVGARRKAQIQRVAIEVAPE
jgi:hypothetical protein